jgi:hypothetical protein
MAASVAITGDLGGVGGFALRAVQVTMDDSYAAGGEAITANSCRLGAIYGAVFTPNGGWIPEWDQSNLKIKAKGQLAAGLQVVTKTVAVASMTDNTNTTGYIDFASSALPIGAIPVMSKFACSAGFAGDTTATWQLGIAGDLDRYSALTSNSCFTAITTSALPKNATAVQGTDAARTPRLTITGTADFTSIVSNGAGAGVASLYYIDSSVVDTATTVDPASDAATSGDISTIVFSGLVWGTP